MSRLPYDMTGFVESLTNAQGCLLLLVLREHLKDFYGFNEAKLAAYSPSESQKIYDRAVNRKASAKFNPKATVEILKLGDVDPTNLDFEAKKDLIHKYLGFKELMNRIEKDDEEVDDDGNVIPQGPQLNARDLQNMGMPAGHANTRAATNGFPGPPAPDSHLVPPGMKIKMLDITMKNIPMSSIPSHVLPVAMAAPSTKPMLESGGGFLDPETGMWVEEGSSRRSSRAASPSPSPDKKSYHQVSACLTTPSVVLTRVHVFWCGFILHVDFKGKKVKRKAGKRKSAADKKKEWDLAQQMWGSLGDSTTPKKKEKKKKPISKKNSFVKDMEICVARPRRSTPRASAQKPVTYLESSPSQ